MRKAHRGDDLKLVTSLVVDLFDKPWRELSDLIGDKSLSSPGVYILAWSVSPLAGKKPKPRDVLYVGMSNSAGGVRARLRQFLGGLEQNNRHSGAKRFFREYAHNVPISRYRTKNRFFGTAIALKCDSNKLEAKPTDFRIMGHVACLEYYVRAHILAETGKRPDLNWR